MCVCCHNPYMMSSVCCVYSTGYGPILRLTIRASLYVVRFASTHKLDQDSTIFSFLSYCICCRRNFFLSWKFSIGDNIPSRPPPPEVQVPIQDDDVGDGSVRTNG
jgi:hypothetical protein